MAAANGPTNNGSVRLIRLIRNSGEVLSLDIYGFMFDPSSIQNLYLENNDVIHVPTSGKVITIKGAVKRAYKYELLENENLNKLLEYTGGLKENAYKRTFRVKRFSNDQQVFLDIPYASLKSRNSDFILLDGDEITVEEISIPAQNFVSIEGTVVNPGDFERTSGMKISDLISLAGLLPESRTDLAYLRRRNSDGSVTFEKLDLNSILSNRNDPKNIELNNQDILTIWSKSRFVDEMEVEVSGAVRFPDRFSYDVGQQVRVSDVITLAGGVTRDAADIAIIHRQDPLNPKVKEYLQVDLGSIMVDPGVEENILLNPFDRLIVMSQNSFLQESFVNVSGAVNSPGQFQFGEGMTLKDVLILSGGYQFGAASNRIEISRMIIEDNQPTQTKIANISTDRDYNIIDSDSPDFKLQPFDQVFVRFVPEFELQKTINISGEVRFPGPYSILSDNEKINNIISRAGGITPEAFPEGATLYRNQDSLGYIVMRLEEALVNVNSRYNYILKDGDEIFVPKRKDFITIRGATKAEDVLTDQVLGEGKEIKVAFHEGKNAKFYIEFYAGGFADDADRSKVFVEYPNGEIKRTKKALFGRKFPEVLKGSTITVAYKDEDPAELEGTKEEVDWTKVLGDSVAQAMSLLTLILLIQQLD